MTPIKVTYISCDGFRKSRKFGSLAGARKFAQSYVGAHPEIGSGYAVSGDGVGTVRVSGATLAEIFPEREEVAGARPVTEQEIYEEEMERVEFRGPRTYSWVQAKYDDIPF